MAGPNRVIGLQVTVDTKDAEARVAALDAKIKGLATTAPGAGADPNAKDVVNQRQLAQSLGQVNTAAQSAGQTMGDYAVRLADLRTQSALLQHEMLGVNTTTDEGKAIYSQLSKELTVVTDKIRLTSAEAGTLSASIKKQGEVTVQATGGMVAGFAQTNIAAREMNAQIELNALATGTGAKSAGDLAVQLAEMKTKAAILRQQLLDLQLTGQSGTEEFLKKSTALKELTTRMGTTSAEAAVLAASVKKGKEEVVQVTGATRATAQALLQQSASSSVLSNTSLTTGAKIALLRTQIFAFKTEIDATSQRLIALNAAQAATGGSSAALAAEIATETGILSALTGGQREAQEQHKRLDIEQGKVGRGMQALTTRITTQRGAFQGLDAILEGVLRTMGGIPLIWAAVIGLGSILVPILLRKSAAAKENVDVDKELLIVEELRAQSLKQLSAATRDLNDKTELGIVAQSNHARSQAQLEIVSKNLRVAQKELKTSADDINASQQAQAQTQDLLAGKFGASSLQVGALNLVTRLYTGSVKDNISKLKENEDQVDKNRSILIAYDSSVGNTTIVVKNFNGQLLQSADSLRQQASQAELASDALDRLSKIRIGLAAPKLDEAPIERLRLLGRGLQTSLAESATQDPTGNLVPNLSQVVSKAKDVNTEIDNTVKEMKALGNSSFTAADAQKEVIGAMSQFQSEGAKAIGIAQALKEGHQKGAGSTKSLANETINLSKQLSELNVQLSSASKFQQERDKIAVDTQAAINKTKSKTEIGLLEEIARKKIEIVDRSEAEAIKQVKDQQDRAAAQRVADEVQRARTIAAIDLKAETDRLRLQFNGNKELNTLLENARIESELKLTAELEKIYHDRFQKELQEAVNQAKIAKELVKAGEPFLDLVFGLGSEKQKTEQAILREITEFDEKVRVALTGRARGTGKGGFKGQDILPDPTVVKQSADALRDAGVQIDQVERVLRLFPRDARFTVAALKLLAKGADEAQIAFAKSVSDIISEGKRLISVENILTEIGDAISQSLVSSLQGTGPFLKTFLKTVLQSIGSQLIALGVRQIIDAIIILANPFYAPLKPWVPGLFKTGALAIAAGSAMLAGSTALGRESSAGGGAGGSANSAGGGGQNRQSSPIPFNTSPNGQRQTTFIIQLDKQGSKDFLDGRGVITRGGVRGKDRRFLKKNLTV